MKYNNIFNTMTIVGTLIIVFLVCLSETSAGGCTQYGHSCWGGHGKRGVVENVRIQPIDDNLLLSRLMRPNRKATALRDLSLIYNRPMIDAAMLKQFHEAKENFEDENDRRNFARKNIKDNENAEEGDMRELLLLTNDATPEKFDLMQILKNNAGTQ